MARSGRRIRLAKGIFRDATGLAVVVRANNHTKEFRLPLNTRLQVAKNAQTEALLELQENTPAAATSGTLAADVAAYVAKLPEGRAKKDREQLLQPWVEALGDHAFAVITRPQIVDCLMQWTQAGLSPTTRNHRLSALRVLWRSLTTDPDKMHPCERVKRSPSPKRRRDRARRMDLIAFVLEHVEPVCHHGDGISHARAQLAVLAWTGQPAATMAQVRPEHFRPKADPPEFYMQPRRKGAGTDAAWKSLTAQGAAALAAWLKIGAWGTPWHNGTLRMAWRRAVTKAQAALREEAKGKKKADRERLLADALSLEGMRVYDLRHSFLTALGSLPGIDIHTVAEYAGHSDIRTSLIYMHGSSAEKVRTGIAALGASMPMKRSGRGKVLAFGR